MTKNKINNKANDFGYIDRLLSIWYNKCSNKVFEYYFNKFATTIITSYLEKTEQRNNIAKFMKNSNISYNDYKALENDIKETFENEYLFYEVFESIIY